MGTLAFGPGRPGSGRLPGAEGGLAGGNHLGLGGGIAELLENPSRPLGASVHQQRRRVPQGRTPKIIGHPVSLHPVEKSRDFDQFRPHRDKTVIDHGARSRRRDGRSFGARLGHGRTNERKLKLTNRQQSKQTSLPVEINEANELPANLHVPQPGEPPPDGVTPLA